MVYPFFQNNKDVDIVRQGTVQVLTSDLMFENIPWTPNTRIPVEIGFNFKSTTTPNADSYTYMVREYLVDTSGINNPRDIGGVRFDIKTPPYDNFEASTDQYIKTNFGTPVTLHAAPQSADVEYIWYDIKGDSIGSGTSITVNPTSTTYYDLRVLHTHYCVESLTYTMVEVNPNYISNISPNPTTGTITIDYFVDPVITTGQINIVSQAGITMEVYNLNLSVGYITADVGKYPSGSYNVQLVCNGKFYDMKSFVKQ
jgi:hypothetical protein